MMPALGFFPRLDQSTAYPGGKVVAAQIPLRVDDGKILPRVKHRKDGGLFR
jgi:hypothetical protein